MTVSQSLPELATLIADLTFVAFDTETTGLSPLDSRIVELSGVKFKATGEVIEEFSTLIDPGMPIPPAVSAFHGITDEMVAGKPKYEEAVPGFFRWVGGPETVLVAHNASFDLNFLDAAISYLGLESPCHQVIDTLSLARRIVRTSQNHKLGTLVDHLQLDAGTYHRALADSHHVRNLLVTLIGRIPDARTWEDLGKVCKFQRFRQQTRAKVAVQVSV